MDAKEISPLPGRNMISTPAKPTVTAIQRRQPTCSPKKGTDNAVIINGAVNPRVKAFTRGMRDKP